MIKQIAIFFVLLLCIPFVSYGVELRYASWNIRWEDPRDVENGDAWEKRKEPIANVIKYHDFDIVGLQEGSPYRLKQFGIPNMPATAPGRNLNFNRISCTFSMFTLTTMAKMLKPKAQS